MTELNVGILGPARWAKSMPDGSRHIRGAGSQPSTLAPHRRGGTRGRNPGAQVFEVGNRS